MNRWEEMAERALAGEAPSKADALAVLRAPDSEGPMIVAAAEKLRRRHFDNYVKLNHLVNVKSGLCPEDCHYCSQSKVSEAPVEKYPLLTKEEIISQVERGMAMGAGRACLVASGRGPSDKELSHFCEAVEALKARHPGMEVCACLGLLKEGQAEKLKTCGVHAYNHNVNTSESHYERICATHTYKDRLDTVEKARAADLSTCSGVLSGMGETDEDLVDLAFTLRDRKVHSIPINFLVSVDGTPLARTNNLTPWRCIKILAMYRFVNPAVEIRISGGREVHLRHLQPIGLMVANSIFIGDYLTTEGQPANEDLKMIRDLGYRVLGKPDDFLDGLLGAPRSDAALKGAEAGKPALAPARA